jgi:hypothetical protein
MRSAYAVIPPCPESKENIMCRAKRKCFMLSVKTLRNAPRIWRDFGSALPFQTRLTHTKPVLRLPNEHGSQVKDQSRRQYCHSECKIFNYRPIRDVSLLSGHGIILPSVICLPLTYFSQNFRKTRFKKMSLCLLIFTTYFFVKRFYF